MKRLLCVFCLLLATSAVQAERLKDLASIQGVRSNQLIGYGLVVGLNGTGDQTTQTPFTLQTFNNMLAQFGIKVPAGGGNVQLKNVAAVSVHAELPPFAKPGQTLDVTISSIGNSKSLRGGSLLMTPLKGIDGNVYAVAQGNLVVGGFDAEGNLTSEPGPIEQTMRILPTGYWKGSAFAIVLDALAAILSEGRPTNEIDKLQRGSCTGCSQVFIVFDPRQLGGEAFTQSVADSVAGYVNASIPAEDAQGVYYPGESTLRKRIDQQANGIVVDDGVWAEVLSLAGRKSPN